MNKTALKQHIKKRLARLFCLVTPRISSNLRVPVLSFFAYLAWKLDKRGRKLSKKNLAFAYPEHSDSWRDKLARSSYKNALFNGADLLWLKELNPTLHNEHVLQEAHEQGKGVCLISLHLGSWEAVPMALRKKNYKAHVLTNVPKSFSMLHQCYQQADIPYICRGDSKSMIQVVQALRSGDIVCFFSDQFGDEVDVKFFDQETQAPAGGVSLAAMLGAKVVISWCWKDTEGQNHIDFERFDLEQMSSRPETVKHNVQRIMVWYEQVIRKYPDQWVWCYNRFKPIKKRARP